MKLCPICNKNPVHGRNRVCDSPICREEMRKSWHEEKIVIPDGYLTASQFAKKKGLTPQGVSKSCRAGKYPGALQDEKSGRWYIPENTKVPFQQGLSRRKKRPFYATDKEWDKIAEAAALTKYNTSEFLIRKALDKKGV
ncbi:MAG: hypothetical protein WC260_04375 [Candidatus Pacearchaeota archaeon]